MEPDTVVPSEKLSRNSNCNNTLSINAPHAERYIAHECRLTSRDYHAVSGNVKHARLPSLEEPSNSPPASPPLPKSPWTGWWSWRMMWKLRKPKISKKSKKSKKERRGKKRRIRRNDAYSLFKIHLYSITFYILSILSKIHSFSHFCKLDHRQ